MAHPVTPDSDFAEPGVDVDHKNRIFVVTNGGTGVQLWRSFDAGKSFKHKTIESPNGGGDSDIEFDLHDVGFTADLAINDSNVLYLPHLLLVGAMLYWMYRVRARKRLPRSVSTTLVGAAYER